MEKKDILEKFSADPDKYYTVKLFQEQGFSRVSCAKCKRYFWTLDPNRTLCPDDGHDTYSFIGNPPTAKRFDYTQAWRQIEQFFVNHQHTSINRYPVVCRWRDDLYFTIASIVDFQRVMGSKVTFEFPANPLIVPQTCLRFNDLQNVGITGRHFSSFCMIGQHSISTPTQGYWKDQCIDLDFELLTNQFGIKKEEITFVEDVWAGGGSFGSSLEYFVCGLELGNAVFTEFQGELGRHTTLDQKIIDMGAGLERFAWITTGTPTAYDCCFGPITAKLLDTAGIDPDSPLLKEYFIAIAKNFERVNSIADAKKLAIKATGLTQSQIQNTITPLENLYMIADHLRTLIFAITDGALPSNVGGGYNLRIMLRRINGAITRLNLGIDIDDLIDTHINYLQNTYPELDSKRSDVKQILKIESTRYEESKSRMAKIAHRLKQKTDTSPPSIPELITLYESDGITPDYLKEINAITEVPQEFYSKLSELHQSNNPQKDDTNSQAGLQLLHRQLSSANIPDTEMLFYKDQNPLQFEAKILKIVDKYIILDKTAFYPRGGGQEPDHGTIAGIRVTDVHKHANIIVHTMYTKIDSTTTTPTLTTNQTVQCTVDPTRRANITKNHTSTHILNTSSRKVLGSWVWQHSAFKDTDHARLDITHHSSLTDTQVQQIEDTANNLVKQNLPITIQYYDRGTAEQKYGFRIYQGGVVPVKSVRIVSIADQDIEACGGTHVKKTGEIQLIKITKTKRIQDGVIRLEFVSGDTAFQYTEKQKVDILKQKEDYVLKAEKEKQRLQQKQDTRQNISVLLDQILATNSSHVSATTTTNTSNKNQTLVFQEIHTKNKSCFTSSSKYNEYFHTTFGKKLVAHDPEFAYCAIFEAVGGSNKNNRTIRVIAYCGPKSDKNAGVIVQKIASILDGAGGGDACFAQGGGKDITQKDLAISTAKSMLIK